MQDQDGKVDVNLEDEAIRGLTVIKEGTVTWPAPPIQMPAVAPAKPKAPPRPPPKGHGHGAGEPMSAKSLAIVFGVGALLFVFVGRTRRPASCRTSPCSCWPASSATW